MSTELTARCAGTNAEGQACSVPPALLTEDAVGRFWCSAHDPDPVAVERRKLASLRGGESTRARHRRRAVLDPGELGPLRTPDDAARWSETIARAVAEGRLAAGAAQATTRALSEWVRARDLHVRETRLVALEQEIERMRGGSR